MHEGPVRRPIRAFLLTPLFFLFLFALFTVILEISHGKFLQAFNISLLVLFFGAPIAYFGALVVGLPVFLILRNTKFETALICVVTTTFAALFIYFFLEVDIFPSSNGSTVSYGDNRGKIIENSVRTVYGWQVLIKTMGEFAILGAISGLIFWRLYSGKWWGRIEAS